MSSWVPIAPSPYRERKRTGSTFQSRKTDQGSLRSRCCRRPVLLPGQGGLVESKWRACPWTAAQRAVQRCGRGHAASRSACEHGGGSGLQQPAEQVGKGRPRRRRPAMSWVASSYVIRVERIAGFARLRRFPEARAQVLRFHVSTVVKENVVFFFFPAHYYLRRMRY